MQSRYKLFIKKHKAFIRDWTDEKCMSGKPNDIVCQYCAEIYGTPIVNLTNPHASFISYPVGPFNHLYKRTFNDQQEPDHAPEIGDIAIRGGSRNYCGIVTAAEPGNTGITIFTQIDWICQIIDKSYDELVWWMTNVQHAEFDTDDE